MKLVLALNDTQYNIFLNLKYFYLCLTNFPLLLFCFLPCFPHFQLWHKKSKSKKNVLYAADGKVIAKLEDIKQGNGFTIGVNYLNPTNDKPLFSIARKSYKNIERLNYMYGFDYAALVLSDKSDSILILEKKGYLQTTFFKKPKDVYSNFVATTNLISEGKLDTTAFKKIKAENDSLLIAMKREETCVGIIKTDIKEMGLLDTVPLVFAETKREFGQKNKEDAFIEYDIKQLGKVLGKLRVEGSTGNLKNDTEEIQYAPNIKSLDLGRFTTYFYRTNSGCLMGTFLAEPAGRSMSVANGHKLLNFGSDFPKVKRDSKTRVELADKLMWLLIIGNEK